MKRLRAAALLLLALNGCDRAEPPPAQEYSPPPPSAFGYDSAIARVATATDTFDVQVEVAERDDQRAYGLMERTSLAEAAGMIFLYHAPQSASSGFWMYRTRIPLDIAFFDSTGAVLALLQMEPCPSPYPEVCRNYAPGVPYIGALEVNRGWFARKGLGVGAAIDLSPLR